MKFITIFMLLGIFSCKQIPATCEFENEIYIESIEHFSPPKNITIHFDIDSAIVYSKKKKKDLLILFSGYSCHNISPPREWRAIKSERIQSLIHKNYVFVTLLVDDRRKLTTPYYSNILDKEIRTKGERWQEVEVSLAKANKQPVFVIYNIETERALSVFNEYTTEERLYQFLR